MRMRTYSCDSNKRDKMATADEERHVEFLSVVTAHNLSLHEFCLILDEITN